MRGLTLLWLVLASASLQGCFPVAAVGVGAGAMVAQDRRTSGTYVEDQAIETKAADRIGQQFKDSAHVNVTSFNRTALISGEAPNAEAREEIARIVAGIENVRGIYNELVISGPSSLTSRSSDSLITSNVKLRFMQDGRFSAEHVKVVTENGTVFLMGLVKRAEADAAAEVARTTRGVQRVIKVFEYLD